MMYDLVKQLNGFKAFSTGYFEDMKKLSLNKEETRYIIIEDAFRVREQDIASYGPELIDYLKGTPINLALFIRSRSGLTQQRFADKYFFAKRTWENWEQGSRQMPPYVAKLLLRVVEEDYHGSNK